MRNGLSHSEAGKIGYEKSRIKRNEMRQKTKEDYLDDPKKCKFCDSILPYEKRYSAFCNHSCSASFNNKIIGRRWGREHSSCLYCGKKLNTSKGKYCNNSCHQMHSWNQKKDMIKSGSYIDANGYSSESCRRILRKYLIEERGNKCEICALTEWLGKPIPLVCDHIDGNAENNDIGNLRLVCNNCDAFSPTYKGRNRGNGRASRRLAREEYKKKNGFSY